MPTCSRQTLVKDHAFLVKPAYYLKSLYGVRGFNASLWRFLLRCTLFCHSVATFLTSVSSYEGGCGFEVDNRFFRF